MSSSLKNVRRNIQRFTLDMSCLPEYDVFTADTIALATVSECYYGRNMRTIRSRETNSWASRSRGGGEF